MMIFEYIKPVFSLLCRRPLSHRFAQALHLASWAASSFDQHKPRTAFVTRCCRPSRTDSPYDDTWSRTSRRTRTWSHLYIVHSQGRNKAVALYNHTYGDYAHAAVNFGHQETSVLSYSIPHLSHSWQPDPWQEPTDFTTKWLYEYLYDYAHRKCTSAFTKCIHINT